MDAQSQRSIEKLDETVIFPMRELVFEEECAEKAAGRITKEFAKTLENRRTASSAVSDQISSIPPRRLNCPGLSTSSHRS